MPLYVADYLADTRRLTTLEHGAYMLLIMDYWRNGGLPVDDERLGRIAGLSSSEWLCVRIAIAPLFHGDWKHKRIDAELKRASEKSDKARGSANNRWKDKQKVHHAKAMPTHSEGNANAMLSQPQSELKKEKTYVSGDANAYANACVPNNPLPAEKIARNGHTAEMHRLLRFAGEQWNDLASSLKLPAIDEIKSGSQRERHLLARLRELEENYCSDPEAGVRALLAKIRGSPYLRGEVNTFRCTFDWVINASNFQKIMEGNYEARTPTLRR